MDQQSFDRTGYTIAPSILTASECDKLLSHIKEASIDKAGARNLLQLDWCKSLAVSLKQNSAISHLLPPDAVAVQCTLFVKSPEKNWLVTLHQDLSIPVQERIDDPACSGWSEKEGVLYTQPPASVLDGLVAVRVHLDECGLDNGPLRVAPGSHRLGRLTDADMAENRERFIEAPCPVPRGGALIMRPLLLHASSKSRSQSSRRVLHFVFGPAALPYGLKWRFAI